MPSLDEVLYDSRTAEEDCYFVTKLIERGWSLDDIIRVIQLNALKREIEAEKLK